MCGRFELENPEYIYGRFKTKNTLPEIRPNNNVKPSHLVPVVIEGREVVLMKWGLVPHWAKDEKIGYKMINARAEGVFEKPAWRGPVKHHRALIPANGFYEWKKRPDGIKQPFFIRVEDQPLFGFAGLYESRQN